MADEFLVSKIKERIGRGESFDEIKSSLSAIYGENDIKKAYDEFVNVEESNKKIAENKLEDQKKIRATPVKSTGAVGVLSIVKVFFSSFFPYIFFILVSGYISYFFSGTIEINDGRRYQIIALLFLAFLVAYFVSFKLLVWLVSFLDSKNIVRNKNLRATQFSTWAFLFNVPGILVISDLATGAAESWYYFILLSIVVLEIVLLSFLFVTSFQRATFFWFITQFVFWIIILIAQIAIGFSYFNISLMAMSTLF